MRQRDTTNQFRLVREHMESLLQQVSELRSRPEARGALLKPGSAAVATPLRIQTRVIATNKSKTTLSLPYLGTDGLWYSQGFRARRRFS
jgi:hypothetical protein